MMDGPKVRAAKSALARAINSGSASADTIKQLRTDLASARNEEAATDGPG